MRIHILGIGGTFMCGVALLAKQSGHEVSGSDLNVYPPMSTQLERQRIPFFEGYKAEHIKKEIDMVIVGNVIKRGNEAMEYVLNQQIPYTSGPQWLADHVLRNRWVMAVAGTHGKTTTSSMLAWILQQAGLQPGFLIGGIPENFSVSARFGKEPYFVIEADEYDSAFFDKRSKFIHYHPKTLVLNNLEYDHADIFPDLAAIKQQFHYLIRTVPSQGRIIYNGEDANIDEVLQKDCYTPTIAFNGERGEWRAQLLHEDGSAFRVLHRGIVKGEVSWNLLGHHNIANALAALASAHQANVQTEVGCEALMSFKSVKRRLELKGQVRGIRIYDDFAHHPTAIATTLAGLRANIGDEPRMIAILEFGSYTMRTGFHKERILESLKTANLIICKQPEPDWGLGTLLSQCQKPTAMYREVDELVRETARALKPGDYVVVMSNSGFDGIHQKLLAEIEKG